MLNYACSFKHDWLKVETWLESLLVIIKSIDRFEYQLSKLFPVDSTCIQKPMSCLMLRRSNHTINPSSTSIVLASSNGRVLIGSCIPTYPNPWLCILQHHCKICTLNFCFLYVYLNYMYCALCESTGNALRKTPPVVLLGCCDIEKIWTINIEKKILVISIFSIFFCPEIIRT